MGLAREHLNGLVELPAETGHGLLPLCLRCCLELARCVLGVRRGDPADDSFELLSLAPLHVDELRFDASDDIDLLAFDPMAQLLLALANALAHLLQGAAPLERVGVELRSRRRGD